MPLQVVHAARLPGLGVVVFAVSALGGQLAAGLVSLAVLAAFGLVVLLLTNRSETVRGLGGLTYLISFAFFRWRG
jgi:hypothetical protein